MLSMKIKWVVFSVAVFLSVCRAAITSFDHHAHYDNYDLETTNPLTHIDSKIQIRRLETSSFYDVSDHGVVRSGKTLIGDSSKDVSTFLMFSNCAGSVVVSVTDVKLYKIDSDDTIQPSTHDIRITPEFQGQGIKGEKLFSYHDKVYEYYRVQHGDRSVIERGSEYWYAHVDQYCPLSVFEVAAVLDYEDYPEGNRYTHISPVKPQFVRFKAVKKPTIKPMCVGLTFKLNWGSSQLIFGDFTDGQTGFAHPGVACNTDFDVPTRETQIFNVAHNETIPLSFRLQTENLRLESKCHRDVEIQSAGLYDYLEHIGDDSRPEFDSIGIWYGGDFNADITVKNITSYDGISVRFCDEYSFASSDKKRFFWKAGNLSPGTNMNFIVQKLAKSRYPVCVCFGYIEVNAHPNLFASYVSDGRSYWNETIGSCETLHDEDIDERLTVNIQMFDESVKIHAKRDSYPGLLFEISKSGPEWYEDFNIYGFVASDRIHVYEQPYFYNYEPVPTNSCTKATEHEDCETSYESCIHPESRTPIWGTCVVFDYCRKAEAKNNTICLTEGTTCRRTYNPDGYECV